jgi:hypothetical protein
MLGDSVRILYFHAPAAWTAYLSFGVVAIASLGASCDGVYTVPTAADAPKAGAAVKAKPLEFAAWLVFWDPLSVQNFKANVTRMKRVYPEAYKSNDLERLETILAISNIQTGDFSEEISVSQILNVQAEYKNQLKSIRAQIRKAKKRVEWGFSKVTNTQLLSKKIKSELKSELNQHLFHIKEFEKQLQDWSRPMVRISKNRYIYV